MGWHILIQGVQHCVIYHWKAAVCSILIPGISCVWNGDVLYIYINIGILTVKKSNNYS